MPTFDQIICLKKAQDEYDQRVKFLKSHALPDRCLYPPLENPLSPLSALRLPRSVQPGFLPMNILLLRPHPGNDRFGLGPFFREPWDFVERHGLQRAGFTILTPLPGTDFYREMEDRIPAQPWSNFDMHHLLWEPQYPPPSAKGPDPSKLPPGSPFPPRPSL